MNSYDPILEYNQIIKNILNIHTDTLYLLTPKVSTCDFVIDTKKMYDEKMSGEILFDTQASNYQEFVQNIYDMLN